MQETWVPSLGWEGQPTPVFLPEKPHGQRSLTGYIVHGVAKSQTWLSMHTHFQTVIYLVEIIQEKRQHVIVPLRLYSYTPFLSYGFGTGLRQTSQSPWNLVLTVSGAVLWKIELRFPLWVLNNSLILILENISRICATSHESFITTISWELIC